MVITEYVTIKHARAILPFPPVPASLSLMQGEHRTYTNLSNEVIIRHKQGHTLQLYTQTNVLGHTNPAPGEEVPFNLYQMTDRKWKTHMLFRTHLLSIYYVLGWGKDTQDDVIILSFIKHTLNEGA